MVRLIASDMDSTLLDEEGRVPEETFGLIRRLRELGVVFVAASGRIRDVLRIQFGLVADEIDYVCANGGEVWVDGRRVFRAAFAPEGLTALVDEICGRDDITAFMSDGHTVYVFGPKHDVLLGWFEADEAFEHVARGLPPEGTEIIKISLYVEEQRVEEIACELREKLGENLVFHVAAFDFIDVTPAGVDKGFGIARVMEERGISADEVRAYGDAMNDMGMLELAGESVAMGNALPEVRAACTRVIGSFREHAVQNDLAELVARLETSM